MPQAKKKLIMLQIEIWVPPATVRHLKIKYFSWKWWLQAEKISYVEIFFETSQCWRIECWTQEHTNTCYISKGSYTLGFTQPRKFQSCTCLLFPLPISSPTVHFWRLFRIFCICLFLSIGCSCHFPAISGSFRACFALVCLRHQCGSSHHSLTHRLLLMAFQALSH